MISPANVRAKKEPYVTNSSSMSTSTTKLAPVPITHRVLRTIAKYLSQPSVRTQLGVDTGPPVNFTSCNDAVGELFVRNMDESRRTNFHIAALLDRGVRVLIYVGTYDWICNWIGNERWVMNLEWSGRDEFVSSDLREWKVDGKKAGRVRSKNGFTFATIDGAGHMVCYLDFVSF